MLSEGLDGIRCFRYRAGWLVLFFSVNEYKFLGLLSVVEFRGVSDIDLHMHIFMMNGIIIIKTLNGVVC